MNRFSLGHKLLNSSDQVFDFQQLRNSTLCEPLKETQKTELKTEME